MAIFDRNVVSRCGAGCIFEAGRVCACGAVAILNRNVVFRCGAGCILKLGVCVRACGVMRWPFLMVTRCLVVAGAPLPRLACMCAWRCDYIGL